MLSARVAAESVEGDVGVETAPRILVLGDSISAAYGMSLAQGWVALMSGNLMADYPGLTVVNASISGETSVGGLARLPALLSKHRPTLVIIELGGNDGLRGYPVKQLRQNLETMTRLSQEAGAAVMIMPMEIPPNYGTRYTQAFRDSFVHVAEQTGAALGPFILDGIAIDAQLMQSDGIHPKPAAQPAMAAIAEPHVRALLDSQ